MNSTLFVKSESLLGAFQGDSKSGKLFMLDLSATLYVIHLKAVSDKPNPPISDLGLPTECSSSGSILILLTKIYCVSDCHTNCKNKVSL